MNRFRPTVTAFEDRLNLSPLAPINSFESPVPAIPRSDPLPVLIVIANQDFHHDDVVVDGRIITGEASYYHPLPKPIRLLETRGGDSAIGLASPDGPDASGFVMSGTDGDQAEGRRTYEPIIITKRVDRSSP